MTLRQLLQDKRDTIARAWLEYVLATYPGDSAPVFKRERDPFANPVGQTLRVGTERILDVLLDRTDVGEVREHLLAIMKIRAVQQFVPSQAVGFVFRLRDIVRAELGGVAADPQFSMELAELEAQIDRLALVAFDTYVECREQIYQLRINEVKRQVSWIMGKVNQEDPNPELVQITRSPEGGKVGREDLR